MSLYCEDEMLLSLHKNLWPQWHYFVEQEDQYIVGRGRRPEKVYWEAPISTDQVWLLTSFLHGHFCTSILLYLYPNSKILALLNKDWPQAFGMALLDQLCLFSTQCLLHACLTTWICLINLAELICKLSRRRAEEAERNELLTHGTDGRDFARQMDADVRAQVGLLLSPYFCSESPVGDVEVEFSIKDFGFY